MTRKLMIRLVLMILSSAACKEVYYPELDVTQAGLVVDGLITDVAGVYTIKLSKAMPYNAAALYAEQGAKVYVEDAEGSRYTFKETTPGNYNSDPKKFVTKYGETYTLVIQTQDHKAYRSSPQVLYPKGILDTLYSVVKNSPMKIYYGDVLQISNINGVEFLSTINLINDPSPYYRFSNTLLVEYNTKSTRDTAVRYCWLKYTPYEYLNLSDKHNNSGHTQQKMGFCPLDSVYYGILFETIISPRPPFDTIRIWRKIYLYMITFKQYHINTDVYQYYKSVNNQLAGRQQILDPISVQCIGNINCTTNPDEPVMGVFEVSSLSTCSYYYLPDMAGFNVDIRKISPVDIEKFWESDCRSGIPPYFWMTY